MKPEQDARLAELTRRFRERLANELPKLREQCDALAGGGDEARQALMQTAHKLAGAGGVFGYPEVSEAAAALEACLAESGAAREPAIPVTQAAQALIDAIMQALPSGSGGNLS